jgi:hypothetical protein
MPTGLCYRRALDVMLALSDLPVNVSVADLLATVANREVTRIDGRTGPQPDLQQPELSRWFPLPPCATGLALQC